MTKRIQQLHDPVLLDEVIDNLHIKTKAQYIDATLGAGGHASEIVKRGGFVLGIDDDRSMLEIAEERLEQACLTLNRPVESCFITVLGNFRNIASIAKENGFGEVDGIIMDLGLSSVHYDTDMRGFSFREHDAPLDMRLNTQDQKVSAADLVNALTKRQLIDLFRDVTGYKKATELSREIIKTRQKKKIETVGDMSEIAEKVMPRGTKIDPSTKPFMALRIAVNTELENLELALPQAFGLLKSGGILEIISFHSLEDRIVKKYFKKNMTEGKARIVTKKPIVANTDEIKKNPRSRSARLRVLKKI